MEVCPKKPNPLKLIGLLLFALASAFARGEATWGIYSGSFDPVHEGHLSIIRNALEGDKLQKLYVLVNITGGKNFKASFEDRKEMIRLATLEFGDRVEIYPVRQDTKTGFAIPLLKALNSGKPYNAYLGEDSFNALPKDLAPDPLRTIKVSPRSGAAASSSAVRAALAQGLPPPFLTPEVNAFIDAHQLYRCAPSYSQLTK